MIMIKFQILQILSTFLVNNFHVLNYAYITCYQVGIKQMGFSRKIFVPLQILQITFNPS